MQLITLLRFKLASSPLYYVTALTAVFESVCSIVDQHQPVVDKYYGSGKMQVVAKRLIAECGKAVKRLLEGWEEERSMKRKVSMLQSSILRLLSQGYGFSFYL